MTPDRLTFVGLITDIFTIEEVAEIPAAVATADSAYAPAASGLEVSVNGAAMTDPSKLELAKN